MGRRETKKAADHARIMAAARELFGERDYDDVTTAELSRVSGVSTGTLFRHIGSKAEILIAVMNESLGEKTETPRPATTPELVVEAIIGNILPFLNLAKARLTNAVVYQREVLYGTSNGQEVAIGWVQSLQTQISEVMHEWLGDDVDPRFIHAIYSSIYMDFLQVTTGTTRMQDLEENMRKSVTYMVEGKARELK